MFVLGTVRGGAYIDHSESLFPITEQELDEVITLLKTQPVFSVTWKKKPPITLSINGPAEEAQLIFDKFTWVDSTFKADIDDAGMKRLLKNFEALKKETDHAQISA